GEVMPAVAPRTSSEARADSSRAAPGLAVSDRVRCHRRNSLISGLLRPGILGRGLTEPALLGACLSGQGAFQNLYFKPRASRSVDTSVLPLKSTAAAGVKALQCVVPPLSSELAMQNVPS